MPNDKFTNRKVAELKGKTLYGLGNNLYVRETPDGRKYYVFRYRQRIGATPGKPDQMTFGRTTKYDIQAAYDWARELNTLMANGKDPKTHKMEERQAAQKAALTRKIFREVAQQYVAERTDPKDPERWVPRTAQQMRHIMDRILKTDLGEVFVNDTEIVQLKGVEIIKSVAQDAPVMAQRFRDFLFGTMDLARDLRCYSGANPFSKEAGIARLAPIRHTSKPHPGWHHRDLPRLMSLLRKAEADYGYGGLWTTAQAAKAIGRERFTVLNAIKHGLLSTKQANIGRTCTYLIDPAELQKLFPITNPSAEPNFGVEHLAIPLLRFLLLTAVRFAEANKMIWDEINWLARTWTIPAERTKKRTEHVVPLTASAYEILRQQQARRLDSRYVFARGPTLTGVDFHLGEPLSRECVIRHLRKISGDPFITHHSFRRNCRSWAKERGHPMEIRRMLLGHAVGNPVDGTYEADARCVAQLRELLEDWASFLNGNVVSLDERRTINA
jgi:integrase